MNVMSEWMESRKMIAMNEDRRGTCFSHLCFITFCTVMVYALPNTSIATELGYQPVLPQFGGQNGQSLGVLQFEKQMYDSVVSKRIAAQREIDRLENQIVTTPGDALIASLTRTLQSRIANSLATDILGGTGNGSFEMEGVGVSYVRDIVTGDTVVTITDINGLTEITIPGIILE